MEQLIKITEHNGKQVVSARESYDFLEVNYDWEAWYTASIIDNDLAVEGEDYWRNTVIGRDGSKVEDFYITLDLGTEFAIIPPAAYVIYDLTTEKLRHPVLLLECCLNLLIRLERDLREFMGHDIITPVEKINTITLLYKASRFQSEVSLLKSKIEEPQDGYHIAAHRVVIKKLVVDTVHIEHQANALKYEADSRQSDIVVDRLKKELGLN